MQTFHCPSCGAEGAFRSSAAVMAVCEYCHSTLLKEADAVKDIGKMSAVLEDYTPLRLHASGRWQGQGFTVVGRLQLRYDAGLWNEWYLLFDDGSDGWLADASGQYMLTRRVADAPVRQGGEGLPRFEALAPGASLFFDKRNYLAGDVRSARCTGGEGELPFAVGAGWQAQVADFREEGRFLTLDYADGYPPALYAGELVKLEQLACQLLRPADEIGQTADRYRGKAMPLACPQCGSPIQYRAGMANFVICAQCHSEVDCTTSTAIVLEKHGEIEALKTSLSPGDSGRIDGRAYTVLGLLQCTDHDEEEASTWVEYLLFNEERGLLWLVEQSDGWDRVEVLDTWPRLVSGTTATYQGGNFQRGSDYESEVLYAAGTFNWRVQAGDRTRLTEFGPRQRRLTRETSATEIVWTLSVAVARRQVAQWFPDKPGLASAAATPAAAKAVGVAVGDMAFCRKAAKVYALVLLVLNLPIALFSGSGWFTLAFALLLLWAPIWVVGRLGGAEGD
ncbi:hypothetical protein BKK79_03380 [Cupriavidus sp. USMAA2-4]|uniref:DUF4178 domain-containing protein n=1 Tax=Cupriavidus sp. USMAA2-4 TaxID=876364 RepID=UPI0008A6BE54|nr:DUF4178 domain-containing protein [Cupriavidus sp. USMAA2-4]AOY90960.1 hypothetical protein BKK79_03380 [Cupriavidus sp. USMAA2-4]